MDASPGIGRRVDRPDRRFHEIFRQRAIEFPNAVAAIHGDERLTYGELNQRALGVARELLDHGVHAEDVVAVVSERNLDWMAAVIGIFTAGACYLPIEPHFPAARINTMLAKSQCRLALVGPGCSVEVEQVCLSDIGPAESCPETFVGPDQLAYIYFTSGSTGEPKGAMIEHAGMLNHLYAKAEDLELTADDVIAQTAPQCFDISLWQLVCGLLVGATTLIVEQADILDVQRFLRRVADVTILQVVPSYLDVVLSALESEPRELPRLRSVLVTGEEVKKELVQRWFAAQPTIRLVNAYGLTETSDDTNHEVMDRVPDGDRIPLGPPVANVRISVVDENLQPVPHGTVGEIVFSGVCVGRGYINDPERTARAFMMKDGERLYRSGDLGRWRPDGKLEFLGRGDSQVKIRGFRIELSEIENRLVALPGVRTGAVVVADGGKHLIAFFTSDFVQDPATLAEQLGRTLPDYMVPAAFYQRESLPLTDNGKVDRKALSSLADRPSHSVQLPETAAERRLAAAWAQVLRIKIEQIGRTDNFYDRGGTSLSAVRVALAVDKVLSPRDLVENPVLSDLARVLDERRS